MITIEKNPVSQLPHTDLTAPVFGKIHTDHLFIAEYKNGIWHDGKIIPFQHLSLSPFTLALHYAQSVFEGMKAFKTADGRTYVFRPEDHHKRLTRSMQRMCMPEITKSYFLEAVSTFVNLEKEWIPSAPGGALYLRPLVFASEARVGVKIAEEYLFLIMACPTVPMYSKPLSVKVETLYTRAAEGGTGNAKCAGNYGAAFYPTRLAQQEGFDQLIWTDAKTHSFIEESGTMNVFAVINGVLTTPPVSGTILEGITRDTLLSIAKRLNIPTEERKISVEELENGFKNGSITEIFGTGTAAVVIPIQKVSIEGRTYGPEGEYSIMKRLDSALRYIRSGILEDTGNWMVFVD
jgi:branched-chain amino acid aminotransferase